MFISHISSNMTSEVPLHVTIISASNLRAMDADGNSDPFVQLYLKSDEDNKCRTEVQNNNLNPVWNAEFDLVTHDPENDELHLCMYDKDIIKDDRMIDEIVIPVKDIISAAPNDYDFDKDCVKTDEKDKEKVKESGRFHFTVKALVPEGEVKARGIDNANGNPECVFSWGEYGSTYSTDFTGYTSGEFESLGELTPSDQTIHHHQPPHFTSTEIKPKTVYSVQGTLHNIFGLISADEGESDIYATLQLFGKSAIEKAKGTQLRTTNVRGNLNPEYNFDFKFEEARKGDSILINAISNSNGKDVVIGTIKVPIINNEGEKEYALLRPKHLEENGIKGNFQSYGTVRLTLHTEKTNNFAPSPNQ